jgi:2'-5' RNA ligase
MYTIVVPIPGNLNTAIQPYREKYDPTVEKHPSGITLLRAFNFAGERSQLYAHLQDIGENHAPIKISLAGWDIYSDKYDWLCLPLIAGRLELIDLRQNLMSGLLRPLAQPSVKYRPHIVIGRLASQTDRDRIKQALHGFEPIFSYRAAKMTLLQRDRPTEVWQREREFGLEATVLSSPRRKGVTAN